MMCVCVLCCVFCLFMFLGDIGILDELMKMNLIFFFALFIFLFSLRGFFVFFLFSSFPPPIFSLLLFFFVIVIILVKFLS